MKLKILSILGMGLTLASCGVPSSDPEDIQTTGFILGNTNSADGSAVEKYFYYIQDTRTGLCYVTGRLSGQTGVLSNVPCTPEVLTLVQNANAATTRGVNEAPGVIIR